MSKVNWILTSKEPNANVWYEMLFDTAEGDFCVTNNWEVKRVGDLRKDEHVRMIKLGPQAKKTSFLFTYEDKKSTNSARAANGALVTARDTNFKKVVEMIKSDRRVFVVNESENETSAMTFTLENPVMSEKKKLDVSEAKFEAYRIIKDYDKDQIIDLAYFFGINPKGKTLIGLKSELMDMNTGIVMQHDSSPTQPKSNLERFLSEYTQESDISKMETEVNKAITRGVITERDGIYWYGSQILGSGTPQIMNFMQNNTNIYSAIKNEMVGSKIEVDDNVEKTKVEEDKELETLRAEAKALGVNSFHNRHKESLLAGMEEARAMALLAKSLDVKYEGRYMNAIVDDLRAIGVDWDDVKSEWLLKLREEEFEAQD